jgi:UDP-N-acetyl-D-glucosamine dehydrogenase
MNPPPALQTFLDRTIDRDLNVAVIGLGYVGLPLALLFAEAGFRVTGFDIDAAKVEALNAGRSYIHRIEPAQIAAALTSGFRATTHIAELHAADAILLCVPPPLTASSDSNARHTPDMSFITSTVEALAPHTRPGQLIVLESTTWPGTTTELVLPLLERLGPCRVDREEQELGIREQGLGQPSSSDPNPYSLIPNPCLLAFSPEREDPGNPTPRRSIPKVIGGVSRAATQAAPGLYGTIFNQTVQMSSPEAAEMTKLLENIYRGVNIALVNELKQLCLAMGIDIWEVIEAASTKPFGFQPFYPGPGIGGHCIPVDPFYLSWRAKQFNQPTRFIELAGEINEAMPAFVVETVRSALNSLEGKKILLLGIAYKRDIDDLRESPALTIFQLLQQAGAEVAYNDPYFPTVGAGRHYKLRTHSTPLDQVSTFDCTLLITDHTAYDIPDLVAASRLFIDTRNATRGLSAPNILRC